MRRALGISFVVLVCVAVCGKTAPPIGNDRHVVAARDFTDAFARSPRAHWNVRARAAGRDCDVLLIETPAILEDALIDAVHYGAGKKSVFPGGVYRFCREKQFRGTAYRDRSGRIWVFGEVTASEAAALEPCG